MKQATTDLQARKAINDLQNVIVILSDGDFNGLAYNGFTAFQGAISGTTLTVSNSNFPEGNTGYGKLRVGSTITSTGSGTNVRSGTTIQSVLTGTGEPGTTTTYRVSGSNQTVSARRMRALSNSTFLSNQCQRAVEAANQAKDLGIRIYVVGYDVAGGGCGEDDTNFAPINDSGITACETLQWMAGDTRSNTYPGDDSPQYFSTGGCASGVNDSGSLEELFADIAQGITNIGSRVIPEDAW
jgi:hypothetical protein